VAAASVRVRALRANILVGTRVAALDEIVETDLRTAVRLVRNGTVDVVDASGLEGVDVELLCARSEG